ncbi:DUF3265 domain-containing protein [Vibrio anguillarum]|uniref:DUF3265 domain-containing protein n=1 Tax=Vibrio anguillarum TaxID=55601 RepID=A0AAW4BEW8_VIBAN|nr:DUF3265 domain-containing protein [Vibrio sp. 1180_3]MBF4247212.1 DUF3265 domain-containing protein [Vibrio anguillarum]MDQ2194999.1 DUF3265 domain-containing protein [Vibrio sp. A14(2019)]MDQ2198464.1 DUF3265 domain-containing protein [Vibrio sp. 2017_1457_11]NNN70836.1 DUF3265 domain-containing protein [Vibrio sp. 3-2(1)]NNN75431.1 DUF3265 domain-containing protein [Vibrio sp. B7]NNN91994.1 DUF3265 domain-containing protein [Vibrio sp. B8-1]NNO07294.1 DUF3265 domain-containing protein [
MTKHLRGTVNAWHSWFTRKFVFTVVYFSSVVALSAP